MFKQCSPDYLIQVPQNYCDHEAEKVITINDTIIMWDVLIVTDRAILANFPDIVLYDKKKIKK